MKKLIFLSLFTLCLFGTAQAQTSYTLIGATTQTSDTVDNAETIYLTFAANVPQARYFQSVCIVYSYTEISGTSGGTATLEWSANGTTWATAPVSDDFDVTAAFTHTDVTTEQTKLWVYYGSAAYSYRIKITGTGTMSGKVKASAVFKNH